MYSVLDGRVISINEIFPHSVSYLNPPVSSHLHAALVRPRGQVCFKLNIFKIILNSKFFLDAFV